MRAGAVAVAAALVGGLTVAWVAGATSTDATAAHQLSTSTGLSTAGVANRPSRGCGADPRAASGTTTQRSLTSGGRERTYLVHLPDAYQAGRALPLVVAFHGRGQSGEIMEAESGLSNLPAIVAYPDGVVSASIDKRAWENAPYAAQRVDDVAFTRTLLGTLESSLCVDLDRVFAVGHSNGGGFAVEAGCRLRRDFAAVAAVSAALYGSSVGCHRPMSVFELHGTDDSIIPYDGAHRPDLRVPNIGAWVRAQAAVNGCGAEPAEQVLGLFVTRFAFEDCASGHPVVHLRVSDGTHGWRTELIGGRPLYARIWSFFQDQQHHS